MIIFVANIEFRVPYSQRYLFNAIPDTNHNTNPTNPNHSSKGNPNPTNPNTRYCCEYGTLNSMFAVTTGIGSFGTSAKVYVRHLGTSAKLSGHIGISAEVSYGHLGTSRGLCLCNYVN